MATLQAEQHLFRQKAVLFGAAKASVSHRRIFSPFLRSGLAQRTSFESCSLPGLQAVCPPAQMSAASRWTRARCALATRCASSPGLCSRATASAARTQPTTTCPCAPCWCPLWSGRRQPSACAPPCAPGRGKNTITVMYGRLHYVCYQISFQPRASYLLQMAGPCESCSADVGSSFVVLLGSPCSSAKMKPVGSQHQHTKARLPWCQASPSSVK